MADTITCETPTPDYPDGCPWYEPPHDGDRRNWCWANPKVTLRERYPDGFDSEISKARYK